MPIVTLFFMNDYYTVLLFYTIYLTEGAHVISVENKTSSDSSLSLKTSAVKELNSVLLYEMDAFLSLCRFHSHSFFPLLCSLYYNINYTLITVQPSY